MSDITIIILALVVTKTIVEIVAIIFKYEIEMEPLLSIKFTKKEEKNKNESLLQ